MQTSTVNINETGSEIPALLKKKCKKYSNLVRCYVVSIGVYLLYVSNEYSAFIFRVK